MSSEPPFGFGLGDQGPGGSGSGPQGSGFGSGAPFFAELEKLLSWQGGPVNWELARQVAVRTAGEGDPPVSRADADRVREAVRLAEVWLDPVTALPASAADAQAWTRVRWVESTLPVWRTLCDPVAGRVVEAMRGGLSSGLVEFGNMPELATQLPPGLDPSQLVSAAGPLIGIMNQIGGLLFGAQVGQAIGTLAREVVSSTEVGLPLGPAGQAALLPANVAELGRGLEIPADEVRIYLALREAASQRLFGHVPWLRARLLAAVEEYARGISVDPEAIGRAIASVDPTRMDPESLQQALGEGVFDEATSPEQKAALARLETALALVEGWVDEVSDGAAAGHLPAAPALRETVRRRRATGGPAEQTFAALVGLELRPRRLREAAGLWRALLEARGVEGRDAVWAHPDLLPDGDDLTDPAAYVKGGGVPGDPVAEVEALGEGAPREDEQND